MTLTLADWIGALLYLATMVAAIGAGLIDGSRSRTPGSTRFHWFAIGALFAGLAAWRLADGEGQVQAALRGGLRQGGQYTSRFDLQGPLIAALVLVAAAICCWVIWRWKRQPLHRAISGAGALGLLAFSLVRLISYHSFDQLIYASLGPLRLNYFIELTMIGAVFYGIWLLQQAKKVRHRKRRTTKRENEI